MRRLAVNGRFFTQATTGTQRYALELTRRLVQRFPGQVVIHVPKGAVVPPEIAAGAVVRESWAAGQLFEQVALPWAARRELLVSLGGPAPLAARSQVATVHDVSVFRHPRTYSRAFRTWYRAMYVVLARRAERVLTVSEFSAREVEDVLGVRPERLAVVPNGSDHVDHVTAVRPPLGLPPFEQGEGPDPGRPACEALPEAVPGTLEPGWVLCVGTFARHKNVSPALDAFEMAGVRSVVVGARGNRRVFSGIGTGRWTRAFFAGRLTDEELVWLYRHACALVFPSVYEGFGIPVVEAQRLGCPVVAMRVDPLPEVAGDGAVLCDPDHPDEIVAAVQRLIDDPAERDDLVERGRRNAQRYTWDASVDTLVITLAELGWAP
ncbi:glycosyltransferase family 4 protein [Monashia sp. NPDC004114]